MTKKQKITTRFTASASSSSSKIKRAKKLRSVAAEDNIKVVESIQADPKKAPNITVTLDYDENLLAKLVYPMPRDYFLKSVFRRHALHVSHVGCVDRLREHVIENGMFDLDLQALFRETSSDHVFAWIPTQGGHVKSIELDNPDDAFTLHQAGHATYCRAPPELEQPLVASMLRGTGMGCGQYDPSGDKMTSLGRGEVEVFAGTLNHFTNWHTDFQDNFTLQLSGSKKWRLKQGIVKHPLRGCTPHYSAPDAVESQIKASRLTCPNFQFGWPENETLNNSIGEVKEIIMKPGDMLYFPAGMWHSVETLEEGISINISLMATTYASLVSSSLQHVLLKHEGWNEVIVDNSQDNGPTNSIEKLNSLLEQLPNIVNKFVNENGTGSILPEPIRRPQVFSRITDDVYYDGENNDGEQDYHSLDGLPDSNDESEESYEESGKNKKNDIISVDNEEVVVPISGFVLPESFPITFDITSIMLKRNPLASLTKMSDVVDFYSARSNQDIKHRFILNLCYAGNEALESQFRIILEDSTGGLDLICRHEMASALDVFKLVTYDEMIVKVLVYYGYFITSEDIRLK